MPTDCLIIGFNDTSFEEYAKMVGAMGFDSGAYRDLNLAFVEIDGRHMRSMDVLNHFYAEGKPSSHRPFHNADFLWPVVTYLGTYLARRGLSFDYVNLFQLEKEKLIEKLVRNDILTVAITTTLYVSPQPILEIVSVIRNYNKTAKIIVGGPYISNQARSAEGNVEQLLDYIGADFFVISSEGEFALANLIRALKSGARPDGVDNILYKEGNCYVRTAASVESNPLEENVVEYSLFPAHEIDEFVTTRTAKSCPFSCAFCAFPSRAGAYLYLGTEHVERELNAIRDIGTVTTLTFIDDTFNVPKGRFKDLLRLMIKNKYGFKWNSFYRCDHGDEETIDLMSAAGCEGVFLGVESGSDKVLERMNKTARRKDYLKAIPLLRDAGISTYASVIIGFPGETPETVQESIDLIEETGPDYFRAQLWYCDPVTPIWTKRDEYKIRGAAFNWSHATMDSKTACDWIDRIFLCIENSIWLPQFGFEQWSTFYLQRKGMRSGQLKTFLKCFNAAVKEKLVSVNGNSISPELLRSLRASCQFDKPGEVDPRPVEVLSGSRYLAAEAFWLEQFGGQAPGSSLKGLADEAGNAGSGRGVTPRLIDPLTSAAVSSKYPGRFREVMLAAFSVLLSRLNGREDAVIASAIKEGDRCSVLPLRLRARWDMSLGEFTDAIRRLFGDSIEHGLFAFPILSRSPRVTAREELLAAFDVGYTYCEEASDLPGFSMEETLRQHPLAGSGLGLVMNVAKRGEECCISISCARDRFSEKVIEKLDSYLASMLARIAESADILIGEIELDVCEASHAVTEPDALELFNF